MNDNWIVKNLENALDTWNQKISEIFGLLTQSPESFKGGSIWQIIVNIHGTVQAIALALLVLFFLIGVVKTCGSFSELKRPEVAVRVFIRFILAKTAVTQGLSLMLTVFAIVQGMISNIMITSGMTGLNGSILPAEIVTAIGQVNFMNQIPLWAITLLGGLAVTILSFIIILTVYGRFFKLYMYTALAPFALSTFAGEPTQSMGIAFVKSYVAVCLEGAVIVLACIIYSAFASAPPPIDSSAPAITMVWTYVGELIFNMLVLVGGVKLADRVVREMLGLM